MPNFYAFLKDFDDNLHSFLSGIWRRKIAYTTRSQHVCSYLCVCVYESVSCQRGQCLFLSFIYHELFDRAVYIVRNRKRYRNDDLISVMGDNEPSKGCRASCEEFTPNRFKFRHVKAKEIRD